MAEQKNDGFKPVFINKLKTPQGRVAFPKIDKPDDKGQYADNKYKLYLIFDGGDLSEIKKACVQCAKDTWGGKVNLKTVQWPFRQGTAEDAEKKGAFFEGRTYILPKTKNKPLLVGANARPLEEGDRIYAGCWARLAVTAMSYETTEVVMMPNGQKQRQKVQGVTFLLEAVQKTRDDESFGGGGGVSSDFFDDGEVDASATVKDEDDPANYDDGGADEGDDIESLM